MAIKNLYQVVEADMA